jgi:penicillin-binding protein 1A
MVGYTPQYTVAVWAGDDTLAAQSGVNEQGYIWRDAIDILTKDVEVVDFEKPYSVSMYKNQLVNDIYLNKKDSTDCSTRINAVGS